MWLQKLVDGMQGTVKSTIKRAYRNVQEMALEDFIFGHPAQIALLGIQFQWTADTQVHLCCFAVWIAFLHGVVYHSLFNQMYVLESGFQCAWPHSDFFATKPVLVQAALTLARTDKSIMSKNMKKTEAILREMVMITLRSELTKIQRTNLETCITIHMHQKESTGTLCDSTTSACCILELAILCNSKLFACHALQRYCNSSDSALRK